jgi:hypothetical protein
VAGPRQVVDPPAFTQTPYGLLTVCQFPPITDVHWQNGITYMPQCQMPPASTYDECIAVTGGANAPSPPAFANTVSRVMRGATSFSIYQEFDCAAVGNEEARKVAETALAATESWQVERSFWTGIAGGQPVVFPHLAANALINDFTTTAVTIMMQSAAVVVSGAGFDANYNIDESLGLLEGALADSYNGIGVIHVPQHAVPALDAWGLIRTSGPQMKTINGNLVAVGAGYPGTSPAGVARTADKTWLYATGAIMCFRAPLTIRPSNDVEAFDKSKNTIKMIAERKYVLGWDCGHFAVNAALGVPKGT